MKKVVDACIAESQVSRIITRACDFVTSIMTMAHLQFRWAEP